MKKIVLALSLLVLCALTFAQATGAPTVDPEVNPQNEAAAELSKKDTLADVSLVSPNTNACFTSGAGNSSLTFCVTANGNIVQMQAPQGHPLVSSDLGEGYGVCDLTTYTAYSDFGGLGATGNWGAATTLSLNSKSVKIARTTSDGFFTLTQTITQVATIPAVKIVMALKNNTSAAREVYLLRFVDVDAGGNGPNNFDATENSVFVWSTQDFNLGYGLVMQNLGPTPARHVGFPVPSFQPPPPCEPYQDLALFQLTGVDGSMRYVFDAVVPAQKSLVMTLGYKGF